jgi:carbon-monoxide dehydrogenase medium subunit
MVRSAVVEPRTLWVHVLRDDFDHDHPASGYAIAAAATVVARKKSMEGLIGTEGDETSVAQAAAGATAGVEVNGDVHAPAEYRRHLATVITRRALEIALERAQ